ncbi:MAG: hypothetical protein M1814_005867 [Vezdaea aestivalis]|nr:MAG: hypothetical protein M1814_005867 [Vezdaea aestivalis]
MSPRANRTLNRGKRGKSNRGGHDLYRPRERPPLPPVRWSPSRRDSPPPDIPTGPRSIMPVARAGESRQSSNPYATRQYDHRDLPSRNAADDSPEHDVSTRFAKRTDDPSPSLKRKRSTDGTTAQSPSEPSSVPAGSSTAIARTTDPRVRRPSQPDSRRSSLGGQSGSYSNPNPNIPTPVSATPSSVLIPYQIELPMDHETVLGQMKVWNDSIAKMVLATFHKDSFKPVREQYFDRAALARREGVAADILEELEHQASQHTETYDRLKAETEKCRAETKPPLAQMAKMLVSIARRSARESIKDITTRFSGIDEALSAVESKLTVSQGVTGQVEGLKLDNKEIRISVSNLDAAFKNHQSSRNDRSGKGFQDSEMLSLRAELGASKQLNDSLSSEMNEMKDSFRKVQMDLAAIKEQQAKERKEVKRSDFDALRAEVAALKTNASSKNPSKADGHGSPTSPVKERTNRSSSNLPAHPEVSALQFSQLEKKYEKMAKAIESFNIELYGSESKETEADDDTKVTGIFDTLSKYRKLLISHDEEIPELQKAVGIAEEQVKGLEDRMTTMASELRDGVLKQEALEMEQKEKDGILGDEFNEVNSKLGTIHRNQGDMSKGLDEAKAILKTNATIFEAFRAHQSKLEIDINKVNTGLAAVEAEHALRKFSRQNMGTMTNGAAGTAQKSFDSLHTAIVQLQSSVQEHGQSLVNLSDKSEANNNALGSQSGMIDALNEAITSLDGRMKSLTTEDVVKQMAYVISKIYPDVGHAQAQLTALKECYKITSEDLEKLWGMFRTLEHRFQSCLPQVNPQATGNRLSLRPPANGDLPANQTSGPPSNELEPFKAQIASINTALQELSKFRLAVIARIGTPNSPLSISDRIGPTSVVDQFASLTSRLDALPSPNTVTAMQAGINTVSEAVEALQERLSEGAALLTDRLDKLTTRLEEQTQGPGRVQTGGTVQLGTENDSSDSEPLRIRTRRRSRTDL